MYPFKGCGERWYKTEYMHAQCGSHGEYCTACLKARIEHLESRLLSVLCNFYETPELSHVDIENNLRAIAKNWSRQ